MKERPLLFSAPMVKALLAGTKTQTRRIVKPTPEIKCFGDGPPQAWRPVGGVHTENWICPYGKPGDRLWVKECYAPCSTPENHAHAKAGYTYRADWSHDDELTARDFHWKPSIFCTRAASRITLEITSVRAERLNSISEEDAKAEGCVEAFWPSERLQMGKFRNYRAGYAALWDSINGPGSWALNPWVFAITFKRITP